MTLHRTHISSLFLVVVVLCTLQRVTVSFSLQSTPTENDGDLVFDDDNHHTRESPRILTKHIPVIGDNDEGLPARSRSKKQVPSVDDEDNDYDYQSDVAGSGDPGSGEADPDSTGPVKDLYRMKLIVNEQYTPNFEDTQSEDFTRIANSVQDKLSLALKEIDDALSVTVSKIEQADRSDQIQVTTDINHRGPRNQKEEIQAIVEGLYDVKAFTKVNDPYPNIGCPTETHVVCFEGSCQQRCDGITHCKYGEDEHDCDFEIPKEDVELEGGTQTTTLPPLFPSLPDPPQVCLQNQYECKNDAKCIDMQQKCDKNYDCPDGSDEAPSLCGICDGRFTCLVDDKCLDLSMMCDGVTDCSDNTDETDSLCCSSGFWCDGQCKDKSVECNAIPDCTDGTDESSCRKYTSLIPLMLRHELIKRLKE